VISAPVVMSSKPSLESIVTRFRRESSRGGNTNAELEIRLQDVNHGNFTSIYEALLAKKGSDGQPCPVGPGNLTLMVSAIMDNSTKGRGTSGQRLLRAMRIREIFFEGADRKTKREQFMTKEPLVIPFRVPSLTGISYSVALAEERPDPQGFIVDEGAVIRVKARSSFQLTMTGSSELKSELHWRVDMTVTRQIMGSDAGALKQIIGQMFRTKPPITPKNYLSVLRLDNDDDQAIRHLLRYEVEAEFIGPPESRDTLRPADVSAAAATILRLANPEYVREAAMQAEIYQVAKYIIAAPGYLRRFQHELGLKRLLPAAHAITRMDYRAIYPPKGSFLTIKADGLRAVATVRNGRGRIVSKEYYDSFEAEEKVSPGDTIVDGEFILGDDGSMSIHVFDVILCKGNDLTQVGIEKRSLAIPDAVEHLQSAGVPAVMKAFTQLVSDDPADLKKAILGVYEAKYPFEQDGLIIVEPGKNYLETVSFKWKSDNTIDFLARRAPANVLGKAPFIDKPGHKLHFLFVGINPQLFDALGLIWCPGYSELFGDTTGGGRGDRRRGAESNSGSYHPVQFSPSGAPFAYLYQHPDDSEFGDIDGSIVEMRCAGDCLAAGDSSKNANWEALKVRDDRAKDLLTKRYFGNDYYTAELIWLNYIDPFPINQLWDGLGMDYFMRPKSGIYRAQTAVTSFVKTQRITSLKHARWVVDIGAGKGQDLGRYLDAEVQNLVAVDRDREALSQLVRRKYSFAKQKRGNTKRRTATSIHVLVADATDPHVNTLEKLQSLGLAGATADALVCNLAVHYFLSSVPSMRNFAALAQGVVKIGGQVILTILTGEAVHAAFKRGNVPEGGTWDIFEGETLKYSLKRMYSSNTLEETGQRIGVLLPFSAGNYYEEFLVNTGALTKEFTARGFKAQPLVSVVKSIPAFEARNRSLAGTLTDGDRSYLSLYGELVFTRVK